MAKTIKLKFPLIVFLSLLILSGCSEDEPSTPSPPPPPSNNSTGAFNRFITVDGVQRKYILYVPNSYDGSSALPLMFNFHGYTQSAAIQMNDIGDMRILAELNNFILVYPEGTSFFGSTHWNVGSWTTGSTADDIGFTDAMIDAIAADYNIDESRIYACGYSNGGFFSLELACQLSNRIAAIGTVAATMTQKTLDACDPSHPMPLISIHGTRDNVVSYNGSFPEATMSHEQVLSYWTNQNNTDPDPILTALPDINSVDGSTVELLKYLNGDNGSEVQHYRVISDGHNWPGSFGNMDFDASIVIWEFVSRYNIDGLIE